MRKNLVRTALPLAAMALTGITAPVPAAQAARAADWHVSGQFANGPELFDIAAADTHSGWVVGTTWATQSAPTTPFSARWNGKRWVRAGITGGMVSSLSAVTTSGRTNAWAFGNKTGSTDSIARALHWNGKKWKATDLPGGGGASTPWILSAVTLGPKDTWALGSYNAASHPLYMAHYDGRKWTQAAAPESVPYGQVATAVALSSKNIWALVVERYGYALLHYNGRTWAPVTTPPGSFSTRGGLEVRSSKDIWLAGWQRNPGDGALQSGALHFDGKAWRFVQAGKTGQTNGLISIADDGSGGLWAVTSGSERELWHNVKGRWSKVTPARISKPNFAGVFHVRGTRSTLGVGYDASGAAALAIGGF